MPPPPNRTPVVPVKGAPIKFTGGNFKGRYGWIDTSRPRKPKMQPVIVNMVEEGYENITRCMIVNYILMSDVNDVPTTYVEAMLQQHPDIDDMLFKLCREMAMCSVDEHTADQVYDVLNERIKQAKGEQDRLGHDARWRHVNFEDTGYHTTGSE